MSKRTRKVYAAFVTCYDEGKAVEFRRPSIAAADKLVRDLNAVFKRNRMRPHAHWCSRKSLALSK